MVELVQHIEPWLQRLMGEQVDWKQAFLIGMSPIFLIAFLIEYSVANQQQRARRFCLREVLANLALGAGYQVFEVLMALLITGGLFAWVYAHRLWTVPVNGWTVLPIFVAVEFAYYVFHRTSHRVRWFWAAHVPHHSGQFMNFSTAMRQSILNAFIGSFVFFLPLAWLGIPPAVIGFMLAVDLAYQYFVHTESVGKLPRWFEYVFNTPSHHRAHHGRNPEYIDKNYGGVLIVFDRWLGTFEEEQAPVEYGITHQIRSHNFLVLNVHELVDMLRDVAAPGPWRDRIKHLVMPPDWQRPGHTPVRTWQTDSGVGLPERLPRTVTTDPAPHERALPNP